MDRFVALEIRWRRYRRRLWVKRLALPLALALGGVVIWLALAPKPQAPSVAYHALAPAPTPPLKESSPKESHPKETPAPHDSSIAVVNGAFTPPEESPSLPQRDEEKGKHEEEHCYTVKANILNIREQPHLGASIISRYIRGDEVCARLREGNWLYTGVGWIYEGHSTLAPAGEALDDLASKPQAEPVPPTPSIPVAISTAPTPAPNGNSSLKISSTPSTAQDRQAFYTGRYKKEPSYASAIELARSYFEEKNYLKAHEWALLANNHQKDSLESISIFAKSLYFLDKKREAMEVLERYLRFDSSGGLHRLLQQMRAENLKED